MNLNSVFSLFGFSEENDENKKIKAELEAFKKSPVFKLGMFKKMILNGVMFKKQVLKFFSKSTPELDIKGVDDAGEFMMYSRAYYWVKDFKFKSKEWKAALEGYSDEEFLCAIKLTINYFEGVEEFEKCALLKKIQDMVITNIDKELKNPKKEKNT
jgi:hypothetical protein